MSFVQAGAIYQIVDEGDGNFLLGLGLWDRANEPHTLEVKNRTKGQVVRIDNKDNILGRSPELSNIIYQLMPIDNERIFVGCRNGELLYLNHDLYIRNLIDFKSTGLYFWIRNENMIVATMRSGSILFYNLDTDEAERIQVVDPDINILSINSKMTHYYINPDKDKTPNTILWMTPDHDKAMLRVAYSNGQMRTFRCNSNLFKWQSF